MNKTEEFFTIMQELSIFHSVFTALWKIGVPSFSDSIPTACVNFDKEGRCIKFVFNPDFWDSLDDYSKAFVIAHECLHVILNHGNRTDNKIDEITNTALDIAVNHMLVNNFGFVRENFNNYEQYCWVDTVFDKDTYGEVPNDRNFEYYYHLLEKQLDENGDLSNGDKGPIVLDDHSFLPSEIKDVIEETLDALNSEELKEIETLIPDGGGMGRPGEPLWSGNASDVFIEKEKRVSKFWDKVLKDIDIKVVSKTNPQFVFKNRRMTFLDEKFMIPNEYDQEIKSVIKSDIMLFLDCSGSCHHLRDIFFNLGKTIDPKKYNVRLFARTTEVQEIFPNKKGEYNVSGIGGSDDFSCIERFIQKEIKSKKIQKYPVVIHFTDGGDCSKTIVEPEKPELWYWMLYEDNKDWIPKECTNIYPISSII